MMGHEGAFQNEIPNSDDFIVDIEPNPVFVDLDGRDAHLLGPHADARDPANPDPENQKRSLIQLAFLNSKLSSHNKTAQTLKQNKQHVVLTLHLRREKARADAAVRV